MADAIAAVAEVSAPAAPVTPAVPVVPAIPELPFGTRLYECMWLVDAAMGREDFAKLTGMIRDLVEKGGGKLVNCEKWSEQRIAYPIKRKKRGLYIISHFTAPTDAVIKIERNARLAEWLLRHMVTVDDDGLGTVPVVHAAEDEDFGGGGGERRYFREN
jgi:small subunit ribosomal protein S6